MRLLIGLTLLLPIAAFGAGGGETDLFWRSINFLIFAALVYWLFSGFVKKFLGERSQGIAQAFERAQDKAKEARSAKEKAKGAFDGARSQADGIIKAAKSEGEALAARIADRAEDEIKVLHKLKEEQMTVAENKMTRAVVSQTLGEILSSEDILNNQDAIVEKLKRQVA
ncbi:MAG: hypothetical protein LBU73_02970 [Helicobacteraceae bacterium]|jgi:F-type H+-transporting ATPase subunit b|nr:hypothetical protein [Helicobacteraceae bacterium]